MNTPGHNVAPDGNPWPSQLPPSSSRPANEEGAAAPTPYAKVNLAAREIARAAEKFQGNYQLTFDAAQAIIARFAPPSATNQSTVEALRTSLVECVAYLDRMGQDGVRERAYKALAMPVDSPHPQQPSAGQGEAYELLQAWGALYNTPPLVVGEEWEAMFKSVFAATCKFLARPIPPPPPATGEPPAKEGA